MTLAFVINISSFLSKTSSQSEVNSAQSNSFYVNLQLAEPKYKQYV